MKDLIKQKKNLEAQIIDLTKKAESIQTRKLDLQNSLPVLQTEVDRADEKKGEAILSFANGEGSEEVLKLARRKHQEAINNLSEAKELLAGFEEAETQSIRQKIETTATLEKIKLEIGRALFDSLAEDIRKRVGSDLLRAFSAIGYQGRQGLPWPGFLEMIFGGRPSIEEVKKVEADLS